MNGCGLNITIIITNSTLPISNVTAADIKNKSFTRVHIPYILWQIIWNLTTNLVAVRPLQPKRTAYGCFIYPRHQPITYMVG